DSNETVFSYALYKEMRGTRSLHGLAARSSTAVQMMVDGVAERGHAEIVSGNFFDVLGIQARIGRLIAPSDDSIRGGNPVAVLAHEFWKRRFGGRSSTLNRTFQIN